MTKRQGGVLSLQVRLTSIRRLGVLALMGTVSYGCSPESRGRELGTVSDLGPGVVLQGTEIGRGASILAASSRVVVADRLIAPHIILFDKTGRAQRRFADNGQGPGEVIDPTSLSYTAHGHLAVFDIAQQIVNYYEIGDDSPRFVTSHRLRIPSLITEVVVAGEIAAMSAMSSGPSVMPIVSNALQESEARSVGDLPWTRRGSKVPLETQRSYIALAPSGERLAIAYLGVPELQIVEVSSGRVLSIKPSHIHEVGAEGEFARYYRGVQATQARIYALYCGCIDPDKLSSEVHVFDWEGELRAVLRTVNNEAYSIGVSADDSMLYAATETPTPLLRSWHLVDVERQ